MVKPTTQNATFKKRAKVPGKSLKEKFIYLYQQHPEAVAEEYMRKLDITKDQVYGLRHTCKQAILAINEQRAQLDEVMILQAQREGLLASTQEASDALQAYNESRDRRAHYEGQPSTAIEGLSEHMRQDEMTSEDIDPASLLPWEQDDASRVQGSSQGELDIWDLPAHEDTERAPYDVHRDSMAVQELVEPTPTYDMNISGADGATIKALLQLVGDKVKANGTYALKIELIEV